jgi:hypothetical protein
MALRAAGLVEGGAAGIDLLREAVAILESSPAELERARALTDLGPALRRKGQRSEARDPLRSGWSWPSIAALPPWQSGRTASSWRPGHAPAISCAAVSTPSPPASAGSPRCLPKTDQPRDRPSAVRHREDDRESSRQRLPQARHKLTFGGAPSVRQTRRAGHLPVLTRHVATTVISRALSCAHRRRSLLGSAPW